MVSPPENFSVLELLPPDERRLIARYYPGENWLQSREALCEELGISMRTLDARVLLLHQKIAQHMAQRNEAPPLEPLRHLFKTRFPKLYAQVLEPTLTDLREEYSTALAEGHPWKARRVLLQGCGALAAAAACQLGFSLLGRIAALWKARSPK